MGYKLLSKKELCKGQFEYTIEAPYVTRNAKAGQFVILRVEENGERFPLTIADVDKEKGELTIVFMAVGYSTAKLAQIEVGEEILDVTGHWDNRHTLKNTVQLFVSQVVMVLHRAI